MQDAQESNGHRKENAMRPSRTRILALACGLGLAPAAFAAARTELTVYRSDDAALFAGADNAPLQSGYAVVRESRRLDLKAGAQTLHVDDLPAFVDGEALALDLGERATVLSKRVQALGQSSTAALAGLVGQPVEIVGDNGQLIAGGTLLRADDGLLVRGGDGTTSVVRNYAALRTRAGIATGSRLELQVDAARAGAADAVLGYPTAGLGWRAAYTATLEPGPACRMRFAAQASIANRSGRDWRSVGLTLVAGAPRIDSGGGPRPMLKAQSFAVAAAPALPRQAQLDDYRSYTLPGAVDLADGSLTQVPLYAPRTLDCERTALYEAGNAWSPPRPVVAPDFGGPESNESVTGTLAFDAFDSLPAGTLRVLAAGGGAPQFIGEGRLDDTPRGGRATLALGTVFDLRAARERTAFKLDRQGRSMDEAFRVTLSNAGEAARTVTVRVHPDRWRQWTLLSSSARPERQTPDTLEFRVPVPAGGKATLDYAVRYAWTADQQPQ
jgi:hypothetical protein